MIHAGHGMYEWAQMGPIGKEGIVDFLTFFFHVSWGWSATLEEVLDLVCIPKRVVLHMKSVKLPVLK